MKMDKQKFLDSRGRPLTQSLFLEIGYNPEFAVYTLKDFDHEYEGKIYPSLKRIYLGCEDPIEYNFVDHYLYSWDQWERLCANKVVAKHINQWRYELELKLSSQAVRDIIDMTADDKNFQACKYLAERGWNKNSVGRPKKDTSEIDAKLQDRLDTEFGEDLGRVVNFRKP
jgi:hypothetical protein